MKFSKTLLATTALTVGGAAAFAAGHGNMADSMTLVSWGGAYQSSQQQAYVEPYLEMNDGVSVSWDESSAEAVAKLRAMNEAGNVTWDLVDVVAADAIRLCDEGLAMEIDHDDMLAAAPDGTDASDDFGDLIVSDCYIPQIVYSTTFGYRTDMVPDGAEAPNDICDVFDLETYPGKRALEKRPINNVEWALLCDGVAKEDVYDMLETDEGVQRAFMGSTYNGRLFSVIEEQGQPVGMMWDAQVFDLDGWIIPADLPEDRLARVMDFVKFATDTQRLADQAKYISYGPARASSAPLVPDNMKQHMPTDPANAQNTFLYNYEFWADYRDDIDAKFQAWLAQ